MHQLGGHWRCRHAVYSSLLVSRQSYISMTPGSSTCLKTIQGQGHASSTRVCTAVALTGAPSGLRNNFTAQEGNLHHALSTLFPLCHPTVLTTTLINLRLCGDRAKLLTLPVSAELSTSRVTQLCRYVGVEGTE